MSDNPNVAEVVAFLLGEAPLEGRWFGDEENLPTVAGRPARYWWRSRLRAALEAQASAPGGEVTEEIVAAAHAYFTGWCQDEADDDGPHFTGCSQEQHEAAKRLKTALAARTGKGESDAD